MDHPSAITKPRRLKTGIHECLNRVNPVTPYYPKRNTSHNERRKQTPRRSASPISTRTPPHTLSAGRRHTYATTLIEMGWPMALVQDHLGHTHVATTAVYTALSDDFKDRVLYQSLGLKWDDDSEQGAIS
jgi:integrase